MTMSLSDWKANTEKERKNKDTFFAQSWQSPLAPQDRPQFKGLQYYPPGSSCRFELELHEHPEKRMVRMAYTKGNEQDFIRWGEFRFKIAGKEQALQAYKRSREEEMLFVPFKDATSGKETYGVGRYLDLEPERDRTADGKWILHSIKVYQRPRKVKLIPPDFRERAMLAVTRAYGCCYCFYFDIREVLRSGIDEQVIAGLLSGSVENCPKEGARLDDTSGKTVR